MYFTYCKSLNEKDESEDVGGKVVRNEKTHIIEGNLSRVLGFLFEHGRLVTAFKIKPILLERELDFDDEIGDMSEAYDALSLVEDMAYKAGFGEIQFDMESFLDVYPEYSPVAWDIYNDAKCDMATLRSI